MLNPNSITVTKEQNDNVTIQIVGEKSFNLLSESYLTKMINSVVVRGKSGNLLYEFFFNEVNEVIRKDGTIVSITDNDILFDEFNQFFFFINNDSVSPGGLTNLPVGNFVFVNPLGNDGTGIREDYAFPFLTLNAAKLAALPGDTIYVYGGTYNEANTLHKDGVKWHFVGKPIVNCSAARVFSDDITGLTDIQVQGDAIFNHISIGQFVYVDNDSTINFNCYSVTALGQQVFLLGNGSGILNVTTKIEVTLVDRCIQLEAGLGSHYVINCDDIFCNATTGGVANAINHRASFLGTCIINARIIRSERAFGSTITTAPNMTGTTTINVSDRISFDQATTSTIQKDSAIAHLGGNLIINGDIFGNLGNAITLQTQSGAAGKYLEHNGNAENDGTLPLIEHGADAGFWAGRYFTMKLNGVYTSSNEKVIKNGGVGGAGANKISVNGRIESLYNDIGTNYGIYLQSTAGSTIAESLIIIMTANGTPESIGSIVAKDVKVFNHVGTNANPSGNITNLITGTDITVDADYE